MTSQPAFAAVDWGTTSFRIWLMTERGEVVGERRSAEGLTALAQDAFPAILEKHLEALGAPGDLPVVICGMAGSRQGWTEARYLDVPASLDEVVSNAVAPPDAARRVMILPGVAQRDEDRADVIRGEETQLIGAAAELRASGSDGSYCMPGTHSKWVRLEGRRIVGFSTFMTGELFALMARHSILAHTVGSAEANPDAPAFRAAVVAGHRNPELLTSRMFSVRGGQLLFADTPEKAAARLSGFIIGAELAGSGCRPGIAPVRLVVSGKLSALYHSALAAIGVGVEEIDADRAVRGGLALAARALGLIDNGRLSA